MVTRRADGKLSEVSRFQCGPVGSVTLTT